VGPSHHEPEGVEAKERSGGAGTAAVVIVRKTGALADEAGDEGPGGAGEPVGKAKQPRAPVEYQDGQRGVTFLTPWPISTAGSTRRRAHAMHISKSARRSNPRFSPPFNPST